MTDGSGPLLLSPTPTAPEEFNLQNAQAVELGVIIPSYNERKNIPLLVERLRRVLNGVSWEAIIVDDDSPDGTADEVRGLAAHDRSLRLIHRIGRRGLASACIEGMLATSAEFVAVMDADLQHDESILPEMLRQIRSGNVDLVVATRNSQGGSKGEFEKKRVLLSDLGARLSSLVCKTQLSDPMSGFFMLTRSLFQDVAHRLSATGFKILVDIVASAGRELRVIEVPYTFRSREHGESKLDLSVGLEYLYLLVEKFSRGVVPARFTMFVLVGGTGILVHLATLSFLYLSLRTSFLYGQAIATVVAMTWNFFLNNLITFRYARLHGRRLLVGLLFFYLSCSLGALTNLTVAQYVFQHGGLWVVAAISGTVVSSVWNFVVSSMLTWNRRN